MIKLNYPSNPTDGTIIELEPDLYFQYDAITDSWIEIEVTNLSAQLATDTTAGAMDHNDLRKLNRMVLPPPLSTITATGCTATFNTGTIGLRSLDDLVTVESTSKLISTDGVQEFPSQILEHTYGINFRLELANLIQELISRGQFNVAGSPGKTGPIGDTGDPGASQLLTGPIGDIGDRGAAPACTVNTATEIYQAKPIQDLNKVIVGLSIEVDPIDDSKYRIVAQRQQVGIPTATAGLLTVSSDNSSWIMALASTSTIAQPVYYIDIDTIINAIHQKFLDEVSSLRAGMEAVVSFWLQQMSDLFDQQKLALCCALEFCQSRQSHTDTRRHIETTTASAVGKGSVTVQDRSATAAIEIPVAIDCGGAGAPGTTPPDLNTCPVCLFTSTGAPTTLQLQDRYSTVTLSQTIAGDKTFYGCRMTPVPTSDITVEPTVNIPTNFAISCGIDLNGDDIVILDVTYPVVTVDSQTPTNRSNTLQCLAKPGPTPSSWGSVYTISAEVAFTACSASLKYVFNIDAPGLYLSDAATIEVTGQNTVADSGAAGVCNDCIFGTNSPTTLTASDTIGTIILTKIPSQNVFQGCRMVPMSTGLANCSGDTATTSPLVAHITIIVPVLYTVSCSGGSC